MEAGESLVVDIEMNFTDPSKAKDWSVVAWGELGEVSVTMEGHTSDVMPVVGAENDGGNDGDDGADDGDDGADDGDDGADDGEDDDEEPVSYLSQTDINRFTNKVNNIKLWQWADHDCGSKIKKNISKTTEAGVPVNWNLAKHTCDHVNLEVTYYLPTEEWDSMLPENYYGGVTDAGLVGCNVDPNDATQTGCKYIVAANEKIGFISQAAVTKLTKKWVSI